MRSIFALLNAVALVAAVPPAAGLAARRPAPAAATDGGVAAASVRARPAAAAAGSVTLTGHGLGHGRGMGQYGAYGYASEARFRWGYQEILDHYYGGTHLERISAAGDQESISVNLSELDSATVTTVRPHRPGAGLSVDGGPARAGTIAVSHTGEAQTIRATAGDVSVDLPGVGWRSYQGYLEIRPAGESDGSGGQTWNVVPTEEYVAGVVPGESPASWGASGGEAALQAQAVAARSYALAYVVAAGRTCDTTVCQSYRGDPSTVGLGTWAHYTDAATSSTAGEVMCTTAVSPCPGPDIASTEYSSSTGGFTAGGTFPAVVDAGDAVPANPFHDWTTTLPLAAVESDYPGVGPITSLLVTSRNGHGRAVEVRVTGTTGRVTVSAGQFAADFGLYSNWFRFATEP